VTKKYVFDGPRGAETLEQLFEGRSQLVVYHAMFDPKTVTPKTPYTKEAPCSNCSFWMDNFERVVLHLAHKDVTLIAASRAPLEKLEAYKKRMGWTMKWVSVGDGDFNRDYCVTLTAEEIANGQGQYNVQLRTHGHPRRRVARHQRLLQGRRGRLPHLLDLRAWPRHAQRALPLPGPRPEGSRRGGRGWCPLGPTT
jgi:predicted dithiol-disulfide oxidoreductase (DUF899 family)